MDEKRLFELIEEMKLNYKEMQDEKKYNDYTVWEAKRYYEALQGLTYLYNNRMKELKMVIDSSKIANENLNKNIAKEKEKADKLQEENDKKDKIIDLMAKHICDYGKVCTYNYGATRPEQWKEYFYKKVEEK